MKVKYLLPVFAFIACVTPDPIEPIEPVYSFELWQCDGIDEFKACYSVSLPEPGYTISVAGDDFAYEFSVGNAGCEESSMSVLPGQVRVTLTAEGISDTKYLMIH